MSTVKTKLTPKLLRDFIERNGYADATFKTIEGGEISQAYFLSTKDGYKVLRINSTDEGFRKDKYAADNFASGSLPIPAIEKIGQLEEGLYYSVSKWAEGKPLDQFKNDEIQKLMPAIISVADAEHATQPAGEGYGWWQMDGSGKSASWREALEAMQKAEDDEKLQSVDFYEKNLRIKLSAEIAEYYQYCPDERQLIHGDYGFGNVLSDGTKITGVIDWHNSMYGDPVWDVAWLNFWGEDQTYVEAFRQHYDDQGRLPTDFNERIICYQLIIAANSLAFFAKSEQQVKYDYVKNILAAIKR